MYRSSEVGSLPHTKSSEKRIKYRQSAWSVHEFEVWSGGGELLCRAAALRMQSSVLLWLGGREARLGTAALGVPAPEGATALATPLLGDGDEAGAAPLARRLATALARPVYVCCGTAFDKFTLPLVERALVAEIKSKPECFQ